ncbi:MAG TPA: SCP2 sterol-binding domain-containing protein [Thermoleophilia bacterium]|nr:SCP2 sterol-binding domain-containing protein [Thermoleophilia bacterium]
MASARERFFEEVGKQAHVRLLEHASGTILIELKDGSQTERRYVTIHRGDVSVSSKGAAPDCTIRTDAATFDAIITGKLSAMPAMLRGLLQVEGKINLLVALQALFQPSEGAAKEPAAGYARRRS